MSNTSPSGGPSADRWTRFLKTLGPGLLFASTAIGVSHLVQSTRAGADYSYALLWAVVIANLFKYPAFEVRIAFTPMRPARA